MRWTDENLEAHAAKHFLGDAAQGWCSLLADPTVWAELRAAAAAEACTFAGHPIACPSPGCRAVQRTAAGIYEQIVTEEWAFCMAEGFWVRTHDAGGVPMVCAAGPRGVYIIAVQDRPIAVAKTAYRPGAAPDWVRTAVRKMRGYASQKAVGWNTLDLLRLEAALLRADTTPEDPRIAHVRDRLLGLPREPGAGQ